MSKSLVKKVPVSEVAVVGGEGGFQNVAVDGV